MSLTGSRFSSDSAPRALPSWDSKTRWNNLSGDLSGDLAVNVTAGSSGHTNSPHIAGEVTRHPHVFHPPRLFSVFDDDDLCQLGGRLGRFVRLSSLAIAFSASAGSRCR